jgi:hypothetical protein
MNEDIGTGVVKVWEFARAPKPLQRLAAGASEWIALIPASLALPEVEALFLRWDSETHPVIRRTLANGSILLAGSYPTMATLLSLCTQIRDFPIGSPIAALKSYTAATSLHLNCVLSE